MPKLTANGIVPDVDVETFFRMVAAGVGQLGDGYEMASPSEGILTVTHHKNRARHGLVGLLFMSPRDTITIVATPDERGARAMMSGTGSADLVGFLKDMVAETPVG